MARAAVVVSGPSVYPVSDARFRLAVESACGEVERKPILAEAQLAAVAALLRPSYPLATVQSRATPGPLHKTLAWDAFRDHIVLDEELLRRARSGLPDAVGQLYDRHHELAYDIATRTAEDAAVGADAVIDAFRTLLANDDGDLTVRVRVARAARDGALARGVPRSDTHGRRDPLTDLHRTVVDLAHTHRLLGAEIATVLRLDIGDVRRLANEGLAALAAWPARRPSSRRNKAPGASRWLSREMAPEVPTSRR